MTGEFALKLIPFSNYQDVILQLEKYLPRSILAHGEVNIRRKYGLFKHAKLFVYVPENEKYNSLVFMVTKVDQRKFCYLVPFWDVEQITIKSLCQFLQQIPNWTQEPLHLYGSQEIVEQFLEAIEDLGHDFPMTLIPDEHHCAHVLTLSSAPKSIPSVPDGYTVEKLKPEHGQKILDHWLYPFFETSENMADRISKLSGWGAYQESEGTKELVAWTQRYSDGSIGMTHTLPEHRRKGLAGIVTLRLAEEIFLNEEQPWLGTELDEKYNLKFHKNLGFEIVSSMAWRTYVPNTTKMEDWI